MDIRSSVSSASSRSFQSAIPTTAQLSHTEFGPGDQVAGTSHPSVPASVQEAAGIEDENAYLVNIRQIVDSMTDDEVFAGLEERMRVNESDEPRGHELSPQSHERSNSELQQGSSAASHQGPKKRHTSASVLSGTTEAGSDCLTTQAEGEGNISMDTTGSDGSDERLVSKRGGNLLIVDGHQHRLNKPSADGLTLYWRCVVKGCNGGARSDAEGNGGIITREHSHSPDYEALEKRRLANERAAVRGNKRPASPGLPKLDQSNSLAIAGPSKAARRSSRTLDTGPSMSLFTARDRIIKANVELVNTNGLLASQVAYIAHQLATLHGELLMAREIAAGTTGIVSLSTLQKTAFSADEFTRLMKKLSLTTGNVMQLTGLPRKKLKPVGDVDRVLREVFDRNSESLDRFHFLYPMEIYGFVRSLDKRKAWKEVEELRKQITSFFLTDFTSGDNYTTRGLFSMLPFGQLPMLSVYCTAIKWSLAIVDNGSSATTFSSASVDALISANLKLVKTNSRLVREKVDLPGELQLLERELQCLRNRAESSSTTQTHYAPREFRQFERRAFTGLLDFSKMVNQGNQSNPT